MKPPRVLPVAVLSLLCAVPAGAQTCANAAAQGDVRLDIAANAVRSAAGEMVFTVYPDVRSRFLSKGGKLVRARVPARVGTTQACFWVAPGYYAVATYHDENGDRHFNRSLFAIKEGFGFSNDAPTSLGLPSFDKVRFAVPASGRRLAVTTRYSR